MVLRVPPHPARVVRLPMAASAASRIQWGGIQWGGGSGGSSTLFSRGEGEIEIQARPGGGGGERRGTGLGRTRMSSEIAAARRRGRYSCRSRLHQHSAAGLPEGDEGIAGESCVERTFPNILPAAVDYDRRRTLAPPSCPSAPPPRSSHPSNIRILLRAPFVPPHLPATRPPSLFSPYPPAQP